MLREHVRAYVSTCRREGQRDFYISVLSLQPKPFGLLGCSVQMKDNIERVKSVIRNFMILR